VLRKLVTQDLSEQKTKLALVPSFSALTRALETLPRIPPAQSLGHAFHPSLEGRFRGLGEYELRYSAGKLRKLAQGSSDARRAGDVDAEFTLVCHEWTTMALKYQFTWLDPLDLLIFPRLGRMPWGPAPRVHGDGDGSRLCWWSPGRGGTGCRRHSVNVEHTTERELFRCDSIAGPHHSWRCSRL